MFAVEYTVLVLLLILFLALVIPDLFKKFKMPYVATLIIIGSILGPFGFNYVQSTEIIEFFGFLGAAFLMLMAGLEVKLEHFQKLGKKIIFLAVINGIIPFIAGFTILYVFGYSLLSALLVGTVFISSSVAIVISALKGANLEDKEIGKTIIAVVVLEDIFSLILLAIILQGVSPITNFPLPVYFVILIASIILLKKLLPKLTKRYFKEQSLLEEQYEIELRFVLVVLMAVLIYFSALGVHPIVAAFVVGLLLSDIVKSERLYSKLHTIGYGLFVPVFFFIVGMQVDIGAVARFDHTNVLMLSIILGLISTKLISGYLAGRFAGFSKRNSAIFGSATMAQLTTTLAVIYAASTLELLDNTIISSVIILAVVTTILSPLLLGFLGKKEESLEIKSSFSS